MTIWQPDLQGSSDPIYLAVAKAIAADVAAGRLRPGDRLPTHRELARGLGVSIGTVTRGYIEAERRGVISGETGRGTFVRGPVSPKPVPYSSSHSVPTTIDLSANYPFYAHDPDLAGAFASLSKRQVSHLLRYHTSRPDPRHVDAAVTWMRTFGLEAEPDHIVITAGAQHALATILFALTKPGDLVLADELTYPGLIALAELRGLRLHGVAMDDDGMIPEALRAACRQRNAEVLYCMPTLQNPTSAILPSERRQQLADIAREHDLLIIEDDMLRPFVPEAPPPLVHLAPERTLFVASISKAVAAGLRVAYIVAPTFSLEKLRHAVWATVWMPSPLTVEIATLWIEDGTARQTTERKRREAETRQQLARDILGAASFHPHPAAFSIWLALPDGMAAADFTVEAARRGVSVTPSGTFAVPPLAPPSAVRVSLGAAEDLEQLRAGLQIVAAMLHSGTHRQVAFV
ncbi:MAG: PLP-dependent aminotransferase family protein [Phycisphaerae bacterium]|nr:PLP-dependent aminotransferase family protein [Phycisphaerae bacterium]